MAECDGWCGFVPVMLLLVDAPESRWLFSGSKLRGHRRLLHSTAIYVVLYEVGTCIGRSLGGVWFIQLWGKRENDFDGMDGKVKDTPD